MSAIAREFDCTPSAISYIVRKAEAEPGEETPKGGESVAVAPSPPAPPVPATTATTTTTTLSLPDRNAAPRRVAPVAPPPPAPPPVVAAEAPRTAVVETPRTAGAEAPRGPVAGGDATASARPGQPPPVDAVEARLREAARGCLVAYRGWRQAHGESATQTLNDAVHELRKVLARIEIDMSASRREEPGMRPIPVPAHRAARQQQRS